MFRYDYKKIYKKNLYVSSTQSSRLFINTKPSNTVMTSEFSFILVKLLDDLERRYQSQFDYVFIILLVYYLY